MAGWENTTSPSGQLCLEQEVSANEESGGEAGEVRMGGAWGGARGAWVSSSGSLLWGTAVRTVECEPREPRFTLQFCHLAGWPWESHFGSVLA